MPITTAAKRNRVALDLSAAADRAKIAVAIARQAATGKAKPLAAEAVTAVEELHLLARAAAALLVEDRS